MNLLRLNTLPGTQTSYGSVPPGHAWYLPNWNLIIPKLSSFPKVSCGYFKSVYCAGINWFEGLNWLEGLYFKPKYRANMLFLFYFHVIAVLFLFLSLPWGSVYRFLYSISKVPRLLQRSTSPVIGNPGSLCVTHDIT